MTQVLCDACVLDATSLTWRLKEPTPFARCAHTAVALPSGAPLCLPAVRFAIALTAYVVGASILHLRFWQFTTTPDVMPPQVNTAVLMKLETH